MQALFYWVNGKSFHLNFRILNNFHEKRGTVKFPWNYHDTQKCLLSFFKRSFVSTKWVLCDIVNTNATQFEFCSGTVKMTCFLREKLNISGYMAAPNSTLVSFDSTKLALNYGTDYKIKTKGLRMIKCKKLIFQFFRHAFFQLDNSTKIVVGVIW